MGHFGRRPIRLAWFSLCFPALLLNYFGQGALLLERGPAPSANPFYRLAPEWSLYPLVVLATAATVIASQAVISGAFSLTRQAVQLGYLPRAGDRPHLGAKRVGQIYVPEINRLLMVGLHRAVLGFRARRSWRRPTASRSWAAMVITTVLLSFGRHRALAVAVRPGASVTVGFLFVELPFLLANIPQDHPAAGWFPLLVGRSCSPC